MAENEKEVLKSESGEENVNDSIDYIEAIKEMKQNSVSKESYEKVKQENKKLMTKKQFYMPLAIINMIYLKSK